MKMVLATNNLHKLREFKAILKALFPSIDLYSLRDFPDYKAQEEIGQSFEEIAIAKATHAAKQLNALVLADDSGLVVPALGGAPGVLSARYAGNEATDKDNRIKLIQKINELPEKDRSSYFECAIAIASNKGLLKCSKGTCEGYLLTQEKGGGGFRYDPIFVKYDYNKTLAELDEAIKNRISHRRKALDRLVPTIDALLLQED